MKHYGGLKRFFILWAVSAVALVVVVRIIPGVAAHGAVPLLTAALVLGFLNAFIRPLFILFTLPLGIFSFGFFILLINGFLFFLTAKLVPGFTVSGFWDAFLAALVFGLISLFLNHLITPENRLVMSGPGLDADRPPADRKIIDTEGTVVDERKPS